MISENHEIQIKVEYYGLKGCEKWGDHSSLSELYILILNCIQSKTFGKEKKYF